MMPHKTIIKERILSGVLILGIFLLVHVLGRVFYTVIPVHTLSRWLFGYEVRQFAYLYGWLQAHGRFWLCMVPPLLAALLGKRRFALTASLGFSIGIPIGEWLGPNPTGTLTGNTHYGWAIWGGIYLASMVLGIVLQRKKR